MISPFNTILFSTSVYQLTYLITFLQGKYQILSIPGDYINPFGSKKSILKKDNFKDIIKKYLQVKSGELFFQCLKVNTLVGNNQFAINFLIINNLVGISGFKYNLVGI
jgi:hypothetical protein